MTNPAIVPLHRIPSASTLLDTLGRSLTTIRDEDRLTDGDIGGVMHKGADQGGKYRTGLAEMGVVAFLRAAGTWNGRFANDALKLVGMKLVPLHGGEVSDQTLQTKLCKLMLEVSVAMEDGQISDIEVARMKRSLIEAGDAIDAIQSRVA